MSTTVLGGLSSIEKTAAQLDALRASRVKDTPVDFDGYMQKRQVDAALIKDVRAFRDQVVDEFHGSQEAQGLVLPWRKVGDNWRIRRGELTVWTGFNSHGKSSVLNYVCLALLDQGEKIGVLSFEMKPRKTLGRMSRQALGKYKPSPEEIDRFCNAYAGRVFLYDQQGDVAPERVLSVITYLAEQCGVTQFVVDSLMKCGLDEDDYSGQKRFVGKLHNLAQDMNVHIHLVHHSRKKEDERTRPGKQDSKGSGAIVDQTDNFVVVFQLPPIKGEEGDLTKPTHMLYVDKQRHSEWLGGISLWGHKDTLQWREGHMDRFREWVQ